MSVSMAVSVAQNAIWGFHVKCTHQINTHDHELGAGSYGYRLATRRVIDSAMNDFVNGLFSI